MAVNPETLGVMDHSEEAGTGGPVTVVLTRRVKPGREAEFEAWLEGITHAAMQFEGHLGVEIVRPTDHRHPEYGLIFRFASYEQLRKWETSEVRREWLARAHEMAEGEPQLKIVTGLEYWFTPAGGPHPPPPWKQALVTWLAIYPLASLIIFALQPVTAGWPFLLRTLATTVLLVVAMTYLVMPHMTRLFSRWLFSQK